MRPILIGIAGASGSGKSELSRRLQAKLGDARIVSLDSYYIDLSEWPMERRAHFNFDHPDALDQETLVRQMVELSQGRAVDVPVYDFATHSRSRVVTHVEPAKFILVEGLFALYFDDLRRLYSLRVFIETPDAVCFERRMARDTRERGRTAESVVEQYGATVRPMADQYVRPASSYADVVVSGTQPIQESVEAVLERIAQIGP